MNSFSKGITNTAVVPERVLGPAAAVTSSPLVSSAHRAGRRVVSNHEAPSYATGHTLHTKLSVSAGSHESRATASKRFFMLTGSTCASRRVTSSRRHLPQTVEIQGPDPCTWSSLEHIAGRRKHCLSTNKPCQLTTAVIVALLSFVLDQRYI
ncbi:hypothetical protein CSUI_011262 [Cystoisospora suis]|uniref:Uncharacterized protein n=1 Tax=Cystoisospora suis TaxID=483139 RepID=A0A2C6KE57_9APIC|nr:hypothetical protein CSUI_011262 [Cystoisospora suis]